jgi:hypothetical protein
LPLFCPSLDLSLCSRFFAALQREPRLALPGATVPATCVFGPKPKTTFELLAPPARQP